MEKIRRISKMIEGNTGSVFVCEAGEVRYLLWEVMDVDTARRLLDCRSRMPYVDYFVPGEKLCLLFKYEKSRPLLRYIHTEPQVRERRMQLCRELVYLCLAGELPWPVLYLILRYRQINMREDGTLYFTYEADLDDLDWEKQEKDCVEEMYAILTELLKEKELPADSCETFVELYQSIKRPERKRKRMEIPPGVAKRMFYLLCVIAAVLLVTVIVVAVSQAAFGEVPLFRFLANPFRQIGTQTLGP